MNSRDRRALERLLRERNEHPERLAEIDRAIHDRFGETLGVLVFDMCRFSRLTLRYGIIHFMAMIQRLHQTAEPIIEASGGRIVKKEADDIFCVFPDAPQAVAAAEALNRQLAVMNAVLPEDWELHVSAGIGYGEILLVGEDDLYGSEVNVASKLGEDVAAEGEILLTEAAFGRLSERRGEFVRREVEVSGLPVTHYALERG
jgi:class 3 adenylate cyclase